MLSILCSHNLEIHVEWYLAKIRHPYFTLNTNLTRRWTQTETSKAALTWWHTKTEQTPKTPTTSNFRGKSLQVIQTFFRRINICNTWNNTLASDWRKMNIISLLKLEEFQRPICEKTKETGVRGKIRWKKRRREKPEKINLSQRNPTAAPKTNTILYWRKWFVIRHSMCLVFEETATITQLFVTQCWSKAQKEQRESNCCFLCN